MPCTDLLMSQTICFLFRLFQNSPEFARKRRITGCRQLLSSRETPDLLDYFWNTFGKGCLQLCHFLRFWCRPRLKPTRQKPVHQLSVSLNDSEKQVFGLDLFVIAQGKVPRAKDSELGSLCEAWEATTAAPRVIGFKWTYCCAPTTKAAVCWAWIGLWLNCQLWQ